MSPNIALRTDKFPEAIDFYSRVLGFTDRSNDPELGDFDAKPLNMFVIEDSEFGGVILELFVENLEKARDLLVKNGCDVVRWRGKGQDCYIRDPYGVIYNLWEDKEI